jgi:hypothetical protein
LVKVYKDRDLVLWVAVATGAGLFRDIPGLTDPVVVVVEAVDVAEVVAEVAVVAVAVVEAAPGLKLP